MGHIKDSRKKIRPAGGRQRPGGLECLILGLLDGLVRRLGPMCFHRIEAFDERPGIFQRLVCPLKNPFPRFRIMKIREFQHSCAPGFGFIDFVMPYGEPFWLHALPIELMPCHLGGFYHSWKPFALKLQPKSYSHNYSQWQNA
jgi:hypothetical protein